MGGWGGGRGNLLSPQAARQFLLPRFFDSVSALQRSGGIRWSVTPNLRKTEGWRVFRQPQYSQWFIVIVMVVVAVVCGVIAKDEGALHRRKQRRMTHETIA